MKKVWILVFIACFLFTNCMSTSVKTFEDLDVQIEETDNDGLLKVTISGLKFTSALSIKGYHIQYDDNKVVVKINEALRPSGMSMDYYIQFLMRKSVNEIYLGKELLWTNSVESYFKSEKLGFPLDINTAVNKNSISINLDQEPADSGLSEQEKKDVKNFTQRFLKDISFEKCKKWKKDAAAFAL